MPSVSGPGTGSRAVGLVKPLPRSVATDQRRIPPGSQRWARAPSRRSGSKSVSRSKFACPGWAGAHQRRSVAAGVVGLGVLGCADGLIRL